MDNPLMFPTTQNIEGNAVIDGGITLLDHFAGLALNALIIAHKGTYAEIYDESYSIADKLLKARKEVYGE